MIREKQQKFPLFFPYFFEIIFLYMHRIYIIFSQTYSLDYIGISVSMFFILKIVLRFFDKLFFFAFFVAWKF